MGRFGFSYFVSTSDIKFKLETWDKDKIIATNMVDYYGACFTLILQIDLYTQEVFVKSVIRQDINSEKNIRHLICPPFKKKPMPIINKLVDESESPWEYSVSLTKKAKQKK